MTTAAESDRERTLILVKPDGVQRALVGELWAGSSAAA